MVSTWMFILLFLIFCRCKILHVLYLNIKAMGNIFKEGRLGFRPGLIQDPNKDPSLCLLVLLPLG